jgi:hypothetical protein
MATILSVAQFVTRLEGAPYPLTLRTLTPQALVLSTLFVAPVTPIFGVVPGDALTRPAWYPQDLRTILDPSPVVLLTAPAQPTLWAASQL